MEGTGTRKVTDIEQGLFIVRYASALDEHRPPKIIVAADPPHDENIDILSHPAHDGPVLWAPGGSLVVRAAAPGRIAIEVKPRDRNSSVGATVRIEALDAGKAASAKKRAPKSLTNSLEAEELRILAHVASIGDVASAGEQWIGGPTAPSRIEGLSIEWPCKPSDIDIHYSVKTARSQPISGQIMPLGAFAGTRGKALPLVGLMLEMSGSGAARFQFVADAIFLGAPATRHEGKRIVLTGPTGREPLVGLRLSIEQILSERPSVQRPNPNQTGRNSGRVRVFRSSERQDRLVAS